MRGVCFQCTFRASLSGTFLQKKDVVNQCLEFASSADSLTVSVQPPCAMACLNICAHVNDPKHWQQYYHCSETLKYYTNSLEWVALLVRLLFLTQVRPPEFSARDKEVLESKNKRSQRKWGGREKQKTTGSL